MDWKGRKLARNKSLALSVACMAIYWPIPGFGKKCRWMDWKGRKLARFKSLAVSVACMAIYWPTPRSKVRTVKFCVLIRWDFNFCVRSSTLREKARGVKCQENSTGGDHLSILLQQLVSKSHPMQGSKEYVWTGDPGWSEVQRLMGGNFHRTVDKLHGFEKICCLCLSTTFP